MRVYFSETNFDFPKKINDLRVAWFREGRICISRNYKKKEMQVQNYRIIQMNAMIKMLYGELSAGFKKDMGRYTQMYKIRYPHLRKRGMSAYSVFLMLVYAIVHRFGLNDRSVDEMKEILSSLIKNLSVAECVRLKLLAVVKGYYILNYVPQMDIRKSFNFVESVENEGSRERLLGVKRELVLKSG